MTPEETPPTEPSAPTISRRTALTVVLGGTMALVSAAGALAAAFLSNALGRARSRTWLTVGPAEDLDPETFRRYVLHAEVRHGWQRRRVPLTVYIKDLYPDDPIALLSTCTHLGCTVQWKPVDQKFKCPCHGGMYDPQGQVTAGPPPRPLQRLEVKIEEGVLFVRFPQSQTSAGTV